MKKKIISIAVVSAIILTTLVGCGNKKDEVSETTEPTTETEISTEAPTTVPTETPVTELKKGNITVTGDFGQATKVDVNELTDSDEYKSIEENLGDLVTSFSCYEISISTADGKTVQPEGTVNVTVKLSDELKAANGNSYAVFYTDGNKIAKVESSVNGDELTFKTTHFSVYTVVKYSSEDKVANATFSNIPNDGVGEMVEINTIKHEHSYNDVVTKGATCTENGVKTFSCECGDSYTEEIGATGHNFGSYTYNNDASYEADGTETATCSVCGATDTRTKSGTKLEKSTENKPEETKPIGGEYTAPDGSKVSLENDLPWDGKWHYWHWTPSVPVKGIVCMSSYKNAPYNIYDKPDGNVIEVITDKNTTFTATFNRWSIAQEPYGCTKDYLEINYNGGIAYVNAFEAAID